MQITSILSMKMAILVSMTLSSYSKVSKKKVRRLVQFQQVIAAFYKAKFNVNIRNKERKTILDECFGDYNEDAEDLIPTLLNGQQFDEVNNAFALSMHHKKLILEQNSFSPNQKIKDQFPLFITLNLADPEVLKAILNHQYTDCNVVDMETGNTVLHEWIGSIRVLDNPFDNIRQAIEAFYDPKCKFDVNLANIKGETILDVLSRFYQTTDGIKEIASDLLPILLEKKQFTNVEKAYIRFPQHRKLIIHQDSLDPNFEVDGKSVLQTAIENCDYTDFTSLYYRKSKVVVSFEKIDFLLMIDSCKQDSEKARKGKDIVKILFKLDENQATKFLDFKLDDSTVKVLLSNGFLLEKLDEMRLKVYSLNLRENIYSFESLTKTLSKYDGLIVGNSENRIKIFKSSISPNFRDTSSNFIEINIDPDNLLESAMEQINGISTLDLQNFRLYVKYKGQVGADAGGLTRAFLGNLMDTILQQKDLFEAVGYYDKFFNVVREEQVENGMLDWYKFAGKIIGLMILNQTVTTFKLSRILIRHLLGLPDTWRDIEELDKPMYNSTKNLLDYALETYEKNPIRVLDLGENVTVSDHEIVKDEFDRDNSPVKYEYLEQVITRQNIGMYKDGREIQLDAMKEGFETIIPPRHAAILYPSDLQSLISGQKEIDLEDWKKHTIYLGIFDQKHETIIFFWQFLERNPDYKLKVLRYATGYSNVPFGGFGNLKGGSRVTIKAFMSGTSNDDDYLPDASACFFTLKLPPYSSYDILERKMKLALDNYSGFNQV